MKISLITKRLLSSFFSILLVLTLCLGFVQPTYAKNVVKTDHNPVVFIHGLGGSSTNFVFMKNYLISQGWQEEYLFSVELPDKILDINNNAINGNVIKNYINNVLEVTGKSKVDIVAHSMGGSNSLYYITRLGGNTKVDKLVTLGGANRLVTSTAPQGVSVTSIYSSTDTIVMNSLSNLQGANNISVFGVSHIGLLYSSKVNPLIVQSLNN